VTEFIIIFSGKQVSQGVKELSQFFCCWDLGKMKVEAQLCWYQTECTKNNNSFTWESKLMERNIFILFS